MDAPGVEEADAIGAGKERRCGRVVGAIEDGIQVDEPPVALVVVVGVRVSEVGQLFEGALSELRNRGVELRRVERIVARGAPPLCGERRSCGGVVAVEPGRRQVAELREVCSSSSPAARMDEVNTLRTSEPL